MRVTCARVIAANRRGTLAPSRPSIITREARMKGGRERGVEGGSEGQRGGERARRASVDDGLLA